MGKVTNNQLKYLKAIFKFRFVSSKVLEDYFNKNQSSIYRVLDSLIKKGYVIKSFDGATDRLIGKSAIYYLAKPGIEVLKENLPTDKNALSKQLRNAEVSQKYIDHTIKAAKLYLELSKKNY